MPAFRIGRTTAGETPAPGQNFDNDWYAASARRQIADASGEVLQRQIA